MFDTDKFIEDCKRAYAEDESHKAVREVVVEAVSDPVAIVNALGEPTEAGFSPLYHSDDLTILNFAWAPLMTLMPHNHNMWAVIGIYGGREDNIFWRKTGDTLEAAGAEALSPLKDTYRCVVRPHPGFLEFGEYLAPYGFEVSTKPTAELVVLSDLFVAVSYTHLTLPTSDLV